jgi:hypothetical protein
MLEMRYHVYIYPMMPINYGSVENKAGDQENNCAGRTNFKRNIHTQGFTIQRNCNMETKRQEADGARKSMEKTVPNLLMEIVVNEERARLLNSQGDAAQAADSIKESPI